MLRRSLALALSLMAAPLCAEPSADAAEAPMPTPGDPLLEQRIVEIAALEAPLIAARETSPDCEAGCITPSEAVRLAFEAGEGEARKGRFLLDIKGGGQSLSGALGELFFVSSRVDYARFGTLTIAFEPDAIYALLRRARVCDAGEFRPGQINVRGCHRQANFDLNMFTMIQRLGGRRIVVDGEARLQWIDAETGLPRPTANKRGEHEAGYYQVWVRVDDADQVEFVYDE